MEIARKRRALFHAAAQLLLGIAGLALITFICFRLGLGVETTAFAFLILIVLVSLLGNLSISVILSLVGLACLNYFFVPPLFDFRIDDPEDIARLAAFLTTSLIVTALTTRGKRVQQQLAETSARSEEAQRLARVGWWERDLISDRVTVSDEVSRILGVRPAARWLNLIHPDDRSKVVESAAAAIRPGAGRSDVEYRVVWPDGTLRVVHSQADVTWDGSGRPLRQFGVLQDITELRQAEQELRASEERFRTLVQFSFDLYWESDAQHRFTRQQFADGLTDAPAPGSEIGKTRWEVPYLEPDEEGWRKHRETLDAHLPFRDFELARPTPEGGKRYVSVSGLPIFDQLGEFVGYRGVGRHITDRKRIEASLRDRERELRELLETIPAMTVTVHPDGTDVSIGKRFSAYSGLSEEDGRGEGWKRCIHPDDLNLHVARWRASLKSGDPVEVETRFRRADGEYRWFLARAAPLRDEAGTILKWYEVLTDIEDRKRADEGLRATQAKLEAAQRIAHVGWWERDFITGNVSLSDEVCRIFGVEPLELPQWHERWLKLIHPEDRPKASQAAATALLPGAPRYDVEYRVIRPDGTERIIHSQGDVTWDETGQPLRQFGVLQDITALRQAEREVRASETRFRTFVDHATDAFLLLDEDWTVLDVNRQACTGLGYRREELIGKHKSDLDVSLDEATIQQLKQRMVSGEAITFETRHRRKNGSSFPVEVRVSQFEQGGRRFLCLVRDISERKRAEDELRDSEERFRTLIQFSFDLYWETDAQHRFVRQDISERVTEGPLPDSELGKTRWELPYTDIDEDTWRKHREILDAHLPFRDLEYARPMPNGGKRWATVSGLPLFDKEGHFIGYRGIARHITDRKTAEEALRRSEAYLAEAQRLSHTGTVAFNATAPLYWSQESYRIWGLDPLQGLPDRETVLQRIHPDDRQRVNAETEGAVREKRDFVIEFRIVLPDGTLKYISAAGQPFVSKAGELVEMVATHVDVTERKRAQQEHERLGQLEADLAHLNRVSMMGELAASLAHEILHPIATARNNARAGIRFLERSPPNLGEVGEALACIVRDADRAKNIVGRMRDHIKKAPPRRQPFDLNEAVNEVIATARSTIANNRVSVRTRLMELPPVLGDRVQLQQVVMNLILNAVEAMSAVKGARELSIATEQNAAGGVLVAVRDSGPGIEPGQIERVFEAFYTTKTSGMGMGLSICRSIIAAHGGRLWAEANRPQGTLFQFILPAALEDHHELA